MSSNLPIGTILFYSLTGAPTDYLLCNGTSYSRTTYSSLYDVIGTTYGSDDSSTFKVPNFTSNFPIGKTSSQSLGQTQGSTSVSITSDNLPSHTHTLSISFFHQHDIDYNTEGQYQYIQQIDIKDGSSTQNIYDLYPLGNNTYGSITTGTTIQSNSTTFSISENLDNSGNSISLDVKNSQMNLNYIIKYA
jgi:microcystin-dependent protein